MMAGDWIKMRIDLQSHPKIVRILSATKADKFRVVGGLHAVWSIFDTHSVDGLLDGYTPEALNHVIGWEGFAEAMISVGWLTFDGKEALLLPEFVEHNGKSGKRRAEDQKRKRDDRKCPQSVHNLSASEADEKLTREEKRREEVNTDVEQARPSSKIQKIFDYWRDVMDSPRSALDKKRINLIQNALKSYSPEDVCRAISGCSKSEFHMGKNDRGTKYNGLDVILRGADKIDSFIALDSTGIAKLEAWEQ